MDSKVRHIWWMVAVAVAALVLSLCSCSTKKNTAASRNYQAFITRYNVYFNGDEHFKETLKSMEEAYADDYTSLLPMHPAEAKANPQAPQPTGDFTRSIEKAQKAIQLHSIKKRPARKSGRSSDPAYKAWMKRDEYNPFLHNAWMMMGRSQYFNGDFLGAASTFYYVAKHFSWLPATVTEAQLWQARAYLFEAETLLRRIKPADLTSGTLKNLYDFTNADWLIRTGQYKEAAPYLAAAAKSSKGTQKPRLYFLLGQVYSRIGDKAKAYEAFGHVTHASNMPYRTQFNARIKQSEVYTGVNIEPEVKALKRMTRYDRNKEYLDQIYYAIGNLYLSRQDTVKAIENYIIAAEKSTRSGVDKAINQITLGELYFAQGKYDLAQPRYAEAMPQLPQSYPGYETLKRRSDVLDELAVYSQNVVLQDSLLRLAAMTPEQQMAVVDKIIADLKKREKEEAEKAKREEYLAQQEANGSTINNSANAPTSFTLNTDDSWYFYNQATLASGRTEFQRRWGSRKLEDDWRRRNKTSFSFSDFDNTEEGQDQADATGGTDAASDSVPEMSAEEKEKLEHSADPHYPEYYLAQIPKTEQEILNSNDVVQEGLYNMGAILKDRLEDYPAARAEWDRLLARYPDNIYRLDVYYALYLMYMRIGNTAEAEMWRQQILHDFPESKYGLALQDPQYIQHLREMPQQQQRMYDEAYDAYLANNNERVHGAYHDMMSKYPLSEIMPKFMFLHALAYVTEKKPDKFNETLREMLERYPDTDITPLASAYLKGMAQGRKLNEGASNLRGMIWDIKLTNDTTAVNEDEALEFDLSPDIPQLLVLVYPTDSVSANQLLFDVARHNFSAFIVKDFDLEQMNFGRLGMLLIKGFANMDELNHYRRVMQADGGLVLPPEVRPVVISEKNFETLISRGRSFDEYFRYIEDTVEERTEAAVEESADGPAEEEPAPVTQP